MSNSPPPLRKLKSPPLAAFLTLLVPGLGQIYQGRYFKGVLFFLCILGTFFFGYRLGDGKVCYWDWSSSPDRRTWAYVCQVWTGAVAWPALIQSKRDPAAYKRELLAPVTAMFEGSLLHVGKVKGEISLTYQRGEGLKGELHDGVLTTESGEQQPFEGTVSSVIVDPQVFPDPRRRVTGEFKGKAGETSGRLDGFIPRSIFDRYAAPLLDQDRPGQNVPFADRKLALAHYELGSRFELGVVYTMVAGLLNILAIWDTLEGPAYEVEEEDPDPGDKNLPKAP